MFGDYHKLCFKIVDFGAGTQIFTQGDGQGNYVVDRKGDIYGEGQLFCSVQDIDPFPMGAVAILPSGVICAKTGNVWIPRPPKRVSTPVFVGAVVPGHENYRFITQSNMEDVQIPGRAPVWFYISLSIANAGATFPGDKDLIPFSDRLNSRPSVVIEIEGVPKYSSQISVQRSRAPVTKGFLAQKVGFEVMKFFGFVDGTGNCLRSFVDVTFGREVIFADLFLVGIVPVSSAAFRPIIAVRTQ